MKNTTSVWAKDRCGYPDLIYESSGDAGRYLPYEQFASQVEEWPNRDELLWFYLEEGIEIDVIHRTESEISESRIEEIHLVVNKP